MYRLAVLNSHPIQYFAPLYRRLAQEPDIDLTVYYCSRWGVEEYLDPGFGEKVQWDIPLLDGYRYKFLPSIGKGSNLKGFFSLVNPAIIGEIKRERHDALWIHGHNYVTYNMAIVAAKMFGTALFMRCETTMLLHRSTTKQFLRKPLMTIFYRLFDACLPIGNRNKEFYQFHGVPNKKLFLVPYTVDNQFFHEETGKFQQQRVYLRSELGVSADKPLILFASKLTERKHPDHLLQAFEKIRKQGVDAALAFVGSGTEEAMLKQYVQENQIPDVHFFGFRNQTELPKFYAIADIFVLPSANEPWGLVVNEVMAAGLPVLTSDDVGSAADLVHEGDNGFTFPVGEIDRISEQLQTLISNDDLRKRMGENSWNIIKDWDFNKCVEGICAALDSINIPKMKGDYA